MIVKFLIIFSKMKSLKHLYVTFMVRWGIIIIIIIKKRSAVQGWDRGIEELKPIKKSSLGIEQLKPIKKHWSCS